MNHTSKKDPRAAATARGSKTVASSKPTLVHNAKLSGVNSLPANDQQLDGRAQRPIFEHARSGNRWLIVQFAEFKGHPFLDIREWIEGPAGRTPTKKGVSVPLGVMRRFGEAIAAQSPPPESSGPQRAA